MYWKPVYNILEGHLELLVVNAQHIKAVPGRKTDVRELRELTRYRVSLVQERTRAVNRFQKTLEDTNLKLGDVASDILGKSARAMLEALLVGQTDPRKLADEHATLCTRVFAPRLHH